VGKMNPILQHIVAGSLTQYSDLPVLTWREYCKLARSWLTGVAGMWMDSLPGEVIDGAVSTDLFGDIHFAIVVRWTIKKKTKRMIVYGQTETTEGLREIVQFIETGISLPKWRASS
jgi:hypothetical protein